MRMLSKWKHLHYLKKFSEKDCVYCINGVSTLSRSAFCTVIEPLEAGVSTSTDESPELPDWVRRAGKGGKKSEDDDFLPPSVSYWIENHKIHSHDQSVDMKSIVNDIVESDIGKISKILRSPFESPDLVVKALNVCDVDVSESLVEQVLQRFSFEWVPAFGFFKWAESCSGRRFSADLYNLMVDNLGKAKKFEVMWELMEEMKKLKGYVTLDTMVKVMRRLGKAGKYEDAIGAFEKLELFGLEKDITAMNILMDALVKHGSVEHAERVYFDYKELIPPTAKTFNMLVNGWCKIRQVDKAKKTIDEMKKHGFCPDSLTYTSFIDAYCREKDFRRVDATLKEMKKNGFQPTVVTYSIIMRALSKAKETDKALQIYEEMKKHNCSPDAVFYSVSIDALSQAGRLKDSEAVFEDMWKQGVVPDTATYNTLILNAAKNLEEEKALNLLKKMEENQCKPDVDTYAPLLKMCCRLNRMKVLSFLLDHMFKNNVSTDPGTYSLLVSRLGKNGKLDRACYYFKEMVLKGFVPMDCTYEILVRGLEKKGMLEEKRCVEELMCRATRPGVGRSS